MTNGLRLQKLVFANRSLSPTQKLVLLCLAEHLGQNETSWPGYGTIAKETSLDRRTVIRNIDQLVASGFLSKKSGPRSNHYLPDYDRLQGATSGTVPLVAGDHQGSGTVPLGVVAGRHQGSGTVPPERPRERPSRNDQKNPPPASRDQGAGDKAVGGDQTAAAATARLLLEVEAASISEGLSTQRSHGNLLDVAATLDQEFQRHAAQNPWLLSPEEKKEVLRLTLQQQDIATLHKRCWSFLYREAYVVRLLDALSASVVDRREARAAASNQEKFMAEARAKWREQGIDPAAPASFFRSQDEPANRPGPRVAGPADPFDDDLIEAVVAAARAERAAS